MTHDAQNDIFHLAADFVHHTGRNIFLTGKAGTGKTTFLKHIQATARKNSVVVAPTGVAAINAGGVTMHSFFQLPMGPFLPVMNQGHHGEGTDIHQLFQNLRINGNKRKLFQELELLIIDEVSMVRADMIDAVDTILRHFRRQPFSPFGGVQVLFIGDMYQLPPVTVEHEWQILSAYYKSPFFFDALVMQQAQPIYIELKKIYRQNEQSFIDVLNRIRNNQVDKADLALLNKKYNPDFSPALDEKFITLCTHNYKADQINNAELQKLPHKLYTYRGEISGEFNDKALPAEMTLQLKEGAQVMFIKNDKGELRRFYNGKLGTVSKISSEEIYITLSESEETILLEKETWRNIRYKLNKEKNSIEEEEIGTYTQYPVRLAWAITIHKSQGLTFDKAVIDAGQSFAAGQVYVALSRCTSLEGLVLHSRIQFHNIYTDQKVIAFAEKESATDQLQLLLQADRKVYEASRLKKLFDWNGIITSFETWQEQIPSRNLEDKAHVLELAETLMDKAHKQQETAIKFQRQLDQVISNIDSIDGRILLEDRMHKAIVHFTQALHQELIEPISTYIIDLRHQKKVKQYLQDLVELLNVLWHKLDDIFHASYSGIYFKKDLPPYTRESIDTSIKHEKGSTRLETLKQFKAGSTIPAIAAKRNLAVSTIQGHLADCIGKKELMLEEVLSTEKINAILPVLKKVGVTAITPAKQELGDEYTYSEVRMVAQHLRSITAE